MFASSDGARVAALSKVRTFLRACPLGSSAVPDDSRRLRRLTEAGSAEWVGGGGAEAAGRGGESGLEEGTRGDRHGLGERSRQILLETDLFNSNGMLARLAVPCRRRADDDAGSARDERHEIRASSGFAPKLHERRRVQDAVVTQVRALGVAKSVSVCV